MTTRPDSSATTSGNPDTPRAVKLSARTLQKTAGLIWLAVGVMLIVRGILMLRAAAGPPEESSNATLLTGAAIGLGIGALKGHYVLRRSAMRNRERMRKLKAAPAWALFTGRMWFLISLMMGFGILLRRAAAAGNLGGFTVIGAVYVGIGAALLASSWVYFAPDHVPLPTHISDAPAGSGAQRTRTGVMVVNLGTPDAPTPRAVRRYLRQFLSDQRVVEVNPWLWKFVLNVIVLPFRSGTSAEAYSKVWSANGSPLLTGTRSITKSLREELGEGYIVRTAMRYGSPSMGAVLTELQDAGCTPIVVLPLFPQYSNSTTGSVQAEAFRLATQQRAQPVVQCRAPGCDDALYIDALAARVEEASAQTRVDFHVFSFHGIPESYVKNGDPYLEQCRRTAWALAQRLGLARSSWEMVFQSRFGPEPWLQPYADEFVPDLAATHPHVLITMPGFAADCLETFEEIGIRLRADFEAAGGESLVVVPTVGDHPDWIRCLARSVREESAHARAGLVNV
ncbi:MAG: ferrochelatase [Chlamydiales bacterium]|jgi:ferrochelatase